MTEPSICGSESEYPSSPQSRAPDAHGQAALLLAESTLHALVEAKALTIVQAISIVKTALEVSIDIDNTTGKSETTQSHSLLSAIENSLMTDRNVIKPYFKPCV